MINRRSAASQASASIAPQRDDAAVLMMGAIEDPDSALHASCVTLRGAGAALLARAQAGGKARTDLNGEELFDLIAALAWLREQPTHARRADRLFNVIASAILVNHGRINESKGHTSKKG